MGAAVGRHYWRGSSVCWAVGEVHREVWRASLQLPHAFHMPLLGTMRGGRGRWGPGLSRGWSPRRRCSFRPPCTLGLWNSLPSLCLCRGSLEDVPKSCHWSMWFLGRPLSFYREGHFCSLSHRLPMARVLTTRALHGSVDAWIRCIQTSSDIYSVGHHSQDMTSYLTASICWSCFLLPFALVPFALFPFPMHLGGP